MKPRIILTGLLTFLFLLGGCQSGSGGDSSDKDVVEADEGEIETTDVKINLARSLTSLEPGDHVQSSITISVKFGDVDFSTKTYGNFSESWSDIVSIPNRDDVRIIVVAIIGTDLLTGYVEFEEADNIPQNLDIILLPAKDDTSSLIKIVTLPDQLSRQDMPGETTSFTFALKGGLGEEVSWVVRCFAIEGTLDEGVVDTDQEVSGSVTLSDNYGNASITTDITIPATNKDKACEISATDIRNNTTTVQFMLNNSVLHGVNIEPAIAELNGIEFSYSADTNEAFVSLDLQSKLEIGPLLKEIEIEWTSSADVKIEEGPSTRRQLYLGELDDSGEPSEYPWVKISIKAKSLNVYRYTSRYLLPAGVLQPKPEVENT